MSAARDCSQYTFHSPPVACSINESDITLDEEVGRGSEGEVWKGELRGHGVFCNNASYLLVTIATTYLYAGTVAIKMATGASTTFDALHDPVS